MKATRHLMTYSELFIALLDGKTFYANKQGQEVDLIKYDAGEDNKAYPFRCGSKSLSMNVLEITGKKGDGGDGRRLVVYTPLYSTERWEDLLGKDKEGSVLCWVTDYKQSQPLPLSMPDPTTKG